MSFLVKVARSLASFNYRYNLKNSSSMYYITSCHRKFHRNSVLSVKMFMEFENRYAYNILETKGYVISLHSSNEIQASTEEQFQNLVKENWSQKSTAEIFEAFSKFAKYCSEKKMCISDRIFDNYIDCLTDNIKNATDDELKSIFYTLSQFPDPISIRTRNYIEVWVALDDECIKRGFNWSFDESLSFIALFYMINVTKFSDFSVKNINKLATRAKNLTPGQLVQTLFYISITRRSPFDMHNLELALTNSFAQFSIDDLAIISMGFFKSKTPIRDSNLVLKFIDAVIDNSKNVHEVSLAALLKLIRYSTKMTLDDRIHRLLEALQYESPRLSVMCNVHIAILGTSTVTLHKECLSKVANTIIPLMSQTRLKDLERLVLTYGTFNFVPPTTECFFTKVMDELRKPERSAEIMNHGRSFACCVAYLGLLQIYPADLMNKGLSEDFLEHTYGKQCFSYGREILTLHYLSEIYCKDAVKNRLSEKCVKILSKKYTDYVPTEEFKKQYNITERMVIDVTNILRESRGGPDYVFGDHVLPFHQRGDLIICDDAYGNPVPVKDAFPVRDFGLLRRPPNDLTWTILVIAGRNAVIYDTDTPTGHFISKISDLKAIGYNAALVTWNAYTKLETAKEKADYLNNLINDCRRSENT